MASKKEFDPSDSVDAPFSPPLRTSMRAPVDDARARADARVAELRGHSGGAVIDDGVDEFYIDRSTVPDGWDYEFKRLTLLNKEDPSYQVALHRTGWEPVPSSRHPEMMPQGSTEQFITRKGMILMERPMEITLEARKMESNRARNQVRIKEQQVNESPSPGHFERHNKGAPLGSIKKGYGPVSVPE